MFINIYGILARHLLKQLMTPFLCCFIGFLFLFLIGDIQDDLSDILKQQGHSMFDIAFYYLCLLPEKIPLIMPMSLLLGTLYCFSNLNRHNEINAIRSSGISIFKMSLPIFILALILSSSLFVSNEFFQTYFIKKTAELEQKLTGKKKYNDNASFIINDDKGERIWSLHFTGNKNEYSQISLSGHDSQGDLKWAIDCMKGTFSPKTGWTFINGQKQTYSDQSYAHAPLHFKTLPISDIKDDPEAMRTFRSFTGLSLSEISKRKNSKIKFSKADHQLMDVKFYSLIFSPFACMIAVLIGIPLSITQQRQGAFTSSAKALAIMIAYYVINTSFINLGNNELLPAAIAGASPTAFFLLLGLFINLKK